MKIDRIFLNDIVTDEINQGILKNILNIAEVLHLNVVYEGVETKTQVDYLKSFQFQIAQGFYYAGVMSKKDIEFWLASNEVLFPHICERKRHCMPLRDTVTI